MTNTEKIWNYLSIARRGEWVREGIIRGIDTDWGFIGFRGDRDVRQMVKDGRLEASFQGKYRVVRAMGPSHTAFPVQKPSGGENRQNSQQFIDNLQKLRTAEMLKNFPKAYNKKEEVKATQASLL